MSDSAKDALEVLIDNYHSQERLRVWSLVITIFGDAVKPRGGEFWLGSLQDLMDRLRIESSAVRTAMSRLTADGWLTRERRGRKSYYRLAAAGESEFADAARKIYAPQRRSWSGEWTIIILTGRAGEYREARRRQLRAEGYGSLSPTVFLRPVGENHAAVSNRADEIVFQSRLEGETDAADLIMKGWRLSYVDAGYAQFIETFSRLQQVLQGEPEMDPLAAMAARSLLIHNFRKVALRDPVFPTELLPDSWRGDEARELAASIYGAVIPASETWLDGCVNARGEPIPKPDIEMQDRFGA